MGRPRKLTPDVHQRIVNLIRGGAFPSVAARAAGISKSTFYRWLDDGVAGRRGPFQAFYLDVMEASALARATAEVQVKQQNPLAWLRSGPGRSRLGDQGWTEPPPGLSSEQIIRDTRLKALHYGVDPDAAVAFVRASLEQEAVGGAPPHDDIGWL